MKRVTETVCGSVSHHSRAAYQWCFSDKTTEQHRNIKQKASATGAGGTVSKILEACKIKKNPAKKKCITTKRPLSASGITEEYPGNAGSIKDHLIKAISKPGNWNTDAMDIAVTGVADLLNVILDIEDVELNTHFQVGHTQCPEKIIHLRRSRPCGLEHYQLIESSGNIRNVMADGNCLFRAISLDRYGNEVHWQRLRQGTADYINDHWDNYVDFIPTQTFPRKAATVEMLPKNYPLNKMMPYLSTAAPDISDAILDYTVASMKTDLTALFSSPLTREQKKSRKVKESFNHLVSHFVSDISRERYQEIRGVINDWEIGPVVKHRLLKRLHYLKNHLNNKCEDYVKLCTSRLKQKDFSPWAVFFKSTNRELQYILENTGMLAQQFSNFLVLSETVDLIQLVHQRGLRLEEQLMTETSFIENNELKNIRSECIGGLIDILTSYFSDHCSLLPPFDNGFHMLAGYDLIKMKSDHYYKVDLDNLIENEIWDDRNVVIRHRVCRLMVERFYQRVPGINLYQETIDNSPLVLKRSMINSEERKLYDIHTDLPSGKIVRDLICFNRGARLHVVSEHMHIFPFVIGDAYPINSVNLKGLPYGERGLSFEKLNHQFIDNPAISRGHLKCIAICANRLFPEITLTGELKVYVEWLNVLSDDSKRFLFRYTPGYDGGDYFLVDGLDCISKKIYGNGAYGSKIITMIEACLKSFADKIANTDELAYVIFVSPLILNGINEIIKKIIERGNLYHPRDDWNMLVEKIVNEVSCRQSLEMREEVRKLDKSLQSYVEKIPMRDLYCYLSQQGNYWILRENETGKFIGCYGPAGEAFKTLPEDGVRGCYLVLRPSSVEVFIADENTHHSCGIYFLDNEDNKSLIMVVINMRGISFMPEARSTYQMFLSGLETLAEQYNHISENTEER
ncbi:hypothetical protein CUN67_03815 [Pantoea cypripedii]|uniref:OTU domain-containing protein n=2 Tax=Pantoea cypripedii TaxID=55209 RepID=A0A6B9FWE9_PANCY|nr:hypothetical protein CUN67_03815 [Pantoea cypripedii]